MGEATLLSIVRTHGGTFEQDGIIGCADHNIRRFTWSMAQWGRQNMK